MNKSSHSFKVAFLAGTVAVWAGISGSAIAENVPTRLLTANFELRHVVQVEVGDFHFKPGQVAPVHHHDAPAIGYVVKGTILYQIEGQRPQLLREGDAFYEPVGPRILRFDNASAFEEAVFVDINLQQEGEPFIVLDEKPKQAIDRRALPTVDVVDGPIREVEVLENRLEGSEAIDFGRERPTLGLVSEGYIELRVEGRPTQRIKAGQSFAVPSGAVPVTIANLSAETPAKFATFVLR